MAMDGGVSNSEQMLGKRLQKVRQDAGLTQQKLCQLANLSYSTLAKIERGAIKAPSIFTIQSIAVALHVGLDDLMGTISPALLAGAQKCVTKNGVRFIFFDVNGCLVRFFQQAFNQIAADYGVPADLVETSFWHYNDDVCRGTMSFHDFDRAFAQRIGVPSLDWQRYYLAAAQPVLEMHEIVKWASQLYDIGLLTNTMPGLVGAMIRSGQLPNVPYHTVIDSSEVGAIKPDKKIFEIAMQQSGRPPEETLLIDDTRGNLTAAEKFGWHVSWFDYADPIASTQRIRESLEPFYS